MSHKTQIEIPDFEQEKTFTLKYWEWNLKGSIFYVREKFLGDELVDTEYNHNLEASGWTGSFNDLGFNFRPSNTNR